MAYGARSGKEFIAYFGKKISRTNISNELKNCCSNGDFKVKTMVGEDVIFSKVVENSYISDRDPHYESDILTVNGYNQGEIERVCKELRWYGITDKDQYHRITNYLFKDISTSMFKFLSKYMHFCSVIWDKRNNSLIAGVTEPNGTYTHLYYGYTNEDKELIFSNSEDILKKFCSEIKEMPNNSFMKDGQFYSIDDTNIDVINNSIMIKNKQENNNYLVDCLNNIFNQVTSEVVKSKIEQNIKDYLACDEPKKTILDYVLSELNSETQKQILMIIKNSIEKYNLIENIDEKAKEKLEERFNEKLEECTKKIQVPIINIVKLNDTELGRTGAEYFHEKFEEVLQLVQLDEPIMLIGPAGSGKNHSIAQIAQALGLHMYYTNNASNEFKLTGFIDAGGTYRDTEFYKAFKNGGIFFLDEIDNSDPSALIAINSALANGYMAFPHETIDRHPNFRMVAAANTWGKGSDLQYVGRNALDGATLDRFDNVFFDYDRKLEKALYPNDEVLEFMWSFRDSTNVTKTPHIISTRGIGKVYKKEINGIPVENILRTNIIRNLGQDDLNTLLGSMKNISSSNKYYKTAKTLKLVR